MLVLDDDRLESMRCSKCRKYLSVFPVKNHPTSRDVTCGRCSSDGSVRSFLYELVAAEYLFRCVNRYEGCGKRLRVDETVAHERLCVGGAFSCPKCEDGVERSALELQWHYKIEHPSSYLHGTSRFDVSPQTSDVKLYIRDDIIAFISARYESDALHLAAATLKEMDVTQEFLVSRGQRLWERTERRPCKAIGAYGADRYILDMELPMSVEVTFALEASKGAELYDVSIPGPSRKPIEDGPKRKMFGVQAEADIEGMFGYKLNDRGTALLNSGGDEISLICSNCKHFIGLPVYRCHKANHQICEDCCTWCGICDDPKVVLTDSGDLIQKIGIHLKFPCKWKCGTYVNTNLRKHERSCKSRIFKCPMCLFVVSLSWSGLTFAKDHLKVSHGILNFLGNYYWSQIKNFVEQKHNGKLSFVKNDKCCYIKWTKAGGGLVDLNLGLCGDEPNIQMALINVSTRMKYLNVVQGACFKYWYYLPYIDFNHKK